MPSDKPDRIDKWRNAAAGVQTIDADKFAQMVLESGLRVVGPYQGYVYAALPTDDGYDMYRALCGHMWIWQSRIVYTQTNVAGGAIIADYTVATGQYARLVAAEMVNSGTNSCFIQLTDEDNARTVQLAVVGSAASTSARLPSIGTAANASANLANSQDFLIPPGAKLSFIQGGAGAQNDTMTISLVLELHNLGTEPTISKARSTNAADVTQGTDSISDANDLQEFVCV